MENKDKFTFALSLSVLNHLGRHLYRSFVTILGEAISNSWDADATNVWVFVDKEKNSFVIKDDGSGMSKGDFQEKFLKIGYSKRKDGNNKSPKGRPFIGRKGIGKLALLSCAERIIVITKEEGGTYVGGTIDNSGLDDAIKEDLKPQDYPLGGWSEDVFSPYMEGHDHGTVIYFEGIKGGIRNTLDLLKKIIALYFRFSLIDESFNIYLDGEKITYEHLKDLADRTQFLWNINELKDPYVDGEFPNLKETKVVTVDAPIKGFIASVKHYRDLNIMNLDEKVGIDLFVNGRLRERDILKHISKSRLVESYLYGQIHFDGLDDETIDRFTSNREGVVADDSEYQSFLKILEEKVITVVINDWDKLRRKYREDGDAENPSISAKDRKSEELFNVVSKEYSLPGDLENKRKVTGWINQLGDDASFNLGSYAECFISENLLRKHIEDAALIPTACSNVDQSGQTCVVRHPGIGTIGLCGFCKGERGMQNFQQQKTDANIAIGVRTSEDSLLAYLEYLDLAKIINNTVLRDEVNAYKPLRNSVMHTARLTTEAKTRLNSIFDNIVATVKRLVGGGGTS